MIAWSGQALRLNPSFGGYSPTSFTWSGDPADGVEFAPNANVEAPTVTITKVTDNPSVVTISLVVDGGAGLQGDTMEIDVYDTACLAAIGIGKRADNPTDLDGNCITNLSDIAIMAGTWLYNGTLTEAIIKP